MAFGTVTDHERVVDEMVDQICLMKGGGGDSRQLALNLALMLQPYGRDEVALMLMTATSRLAHHAEESAWPDQ